MSFSFTRTQLPDIAGVQVLRISDHSDDRGSLWSVWDDSYNDGSFPTFNLDKVSVSKHRVLRGMHGDLKSWKYISVLDGEVFFAIADARSGLDVDNFSCQSFHLSGSIPTAVLLPPSVLNGFYVTSRSAVFFYKWSFCGVYPDVKDQITVKWHDPRLNIEWPDDNPIVQERDR